MKKLLILSLIVFILSCEKTEILNPAEQISKIDLQISGLNAPGDSVWYECWLMWTTGEGDNLKNVFESVGLLTNMDGNEFSKSIDVNPGYIQKVLHLVITMEEDTYPGFRLVPNAASYDTLKGPSIYRIIAAKITANSGRFDIGNEVILDFDFEAAQATYILDTPTDTTSTNLKRGVWFIKPDTTFSEIKDSTGTVVGIDTVVELTNGLELPELPENWLYDGWAVLGSDTVSIGTFTNPIGADDSSKFGAGLAGGYNFPGEDFISNPPTGITFPADLSGSELLITIKPPFPEDKNSPFQLIPFKTVIPSTSESKKAYPMENNFSSFPSGNLTITVSIYN